MNTNHITRFEEIVQRLVEGTFARLFAGRLRPLEVANALAHALEDHAVSRPGELPLAPNHYWVALNPADHDALLAEQPALANDLARHLFDLAREAGFALPDPPTVRLVPQPDVSLHRVQVSARWQPAEEEKTGEIGDSTLQITSSAPPSPNVNQPPPTRPFLILEGRRHMPLLKATINLGRSLDNDIIVDDARVSRQHAQLRQRYDRFVIYDLGSTGGTTVNGYPVQECVLEAGDVISLAGVEIIYGEDRPTPAPLSREPGSTPVMPTPSLGQEAGSPETKEMPSVSTNRPEI
jgi:pSer/pThr/pTyr-binding forkhead associated (FHA) protein